MDEHDPIIPNLKALGPPIQSARASAYVLAIVVDEVLGATDLASTHLDGVVRLSLDAITAEALRHAATIVVADTQTVAETYARIVATT